MRARLSLPELDTFLHSVKNQIDQPWEYIARKICDVHPRTLRDWRNGKFTPSFNILEKLASISGVALPSTIQKLPDYWHIPQAAKLGGRRTYELYGAPGTPAGRRLGGMRGIATRLARGDNHVTSKNIALPHPSKKLAEFVGIMLGDGGMNAFQATISLHRIDDKDYVSYVVKLIQGLFGVIPSLNFRDAVCTVTVSRVKLVAFLKDMGLPIGSKIRHQVGVPNWIMDNDDYSRSCIRGLMDTDGCFYVDKHRYKERVYLNAALNFTNRSLPLLQFYKEKLATFGFTPTQTTPFSVFLRKEPEIDRYLQEIGTSNKKIIDRYLRYKEERRINKL